MSLNLKGKLSRLRLEIAALIRGGKPLEDLTIDKRRTMWPAPKLLSQRHLDNCRVIENRESLLDLMPKNGTCAEIGILGSYFSGQILQKTKPNKLHLIDIDPRAIGKARELFPSEVTNNRIELHCGDSASIISQMPDAYFDWVYIDGDHSYGGAKRDLEAVISKIKLNGLIALNDYVFFAPSDFAKYGVVEAVNEFCLDHDFEMIYLALQGRGYNDVVLRML